MEQFSWLTSEIIWHARNRAGRCAAADAVTKKRRRPSRKPSPSPPPSPEADADAKAETKRATRSELADRRERLKSGVVAMQKAGRKCPLPLPDEEEVRSAASSRSFRGCTAMEARHSSSTRATSRASCLDSSVPVPAPVPGTAAVGAIVWGTARVPRSREDGRWGTMV